MLLMLMKSAFKCNRTFCRKLMTMRKDKGTFPAFRKSTINSNLILKASPFATSSKVAKEHVIEVKELQIPVPYGHIASKAWGKETGTPVLALHGWMDNAGTFDKLIPLLSTSFYIVAIDMPGHGLSSHKPLGSFYSPLDTMIDFKRVVDHLQWTKFSIIGHSMGAAFGQLYASLFPEAVQKVVTLDRGRLLSRINSILNVSEQPEPFEVSRDAIEQNLEIEKKLLNEAPVYSLEAAMKRLQKGMLHEITDNSARILLKRGTRLSESGKGVVFTRDLRTRTMEVFQQPSEDALKGYMSALECEMLLIMSNNTHPLLRADRPEVFAEYVEIYRKHCKRFLLENVDGNHFVHLNHPERIAPLINSFLY